jgi:hypothetical protein
MFQITVHYVGGNTESFDFAEVESARMFMRERDQSAQVAFTTVSMRPRRERLGAPARQRGSSRTGD